MKVNKNYREFRLDNGLFVVLDPTETSTIAGTLRVHHGGINELEGEEGIAHYVEHSIINGGTQKYTPEKVDEIRDNLKYLNAITSIEKTRFPAMMLLEDINSYLDLVSEIAFHPVFDIKRVNEERQRILREIAGRRGKPGYADRIAFNNAMFGSHPITYDVNGKEEIIQNAGQEQLRNFHQRGYNATNMDLILVGGLPSDIESIIRMYFEDKPSGIDTRFKWPEVRPLEETTILHTYAPELLNLSNPEGSNAYVDLCFMAPPAYLQDGPIMQVLNYFLGGNPRSRLQQSISRRKGLAYSINSGYDGKSNSGILNISGEIHARKVEECLDAIFCEINKLQTELIPEKELSRFKKDMKYDNGVIYETNGSRLRIIEFELNEGMKFSDWCERLDAVTAEDIQKAAQRYLPKSRDDGKYVCMVRDPHKG